MMSMPSLVSMCRNGTIVAVKQMIAEKCDVNVETDGSTPIRVAIETNNRKLTLILLDAGATFPHLPSSLLYLAIDCGNADIATLCVSKDEQILAEGILDAACSGHRALVASLISKFKPRRGGSILHLLPWMTQPEENPLHEAAITLIVEECAPLIDETDSFGFTALHIAAGFGNASVAAALVKAGADVNIVGECEFSALMIASVEGHIAVVKVLLAAGPALHIDAKHSDGRTALHMSVQRSSVPVTEALLEARADVAAVCNKGRTPLFYACSADIATMLLDAGADANAADNVCMTPIFTVQNAGVARVLLDANADCNQRLHYGRAGTPLMYACINGLTDVVKLLIAEGADADIQGDFGQTPLILAADKGHLAVVELLLARSTATINVCGDCGMTALFSAVKEGFPCVVDALIAAGADVNIGTDFGVTPLMMAKDGEMAQRLLDAGADITAAANGCNLLARAARENRVDVMKVLLQAPNASVDWINSLNWTNSLNDESTALMMASQNGATAAVELLIQSGANVDLKRERDHRTALSLTKNTDIARLLWNAGSKDTRVHERAGILHSACDSKSHDLVEFLLQCGFDVNAMHDGIHCGSTPLMLAARRGDAEVLRVLLAADPPVNVNQQDEDGFTALFHAVMSDHTMAVKMLLDAGANPRLTDYDDFSPLHYCESAETVALIIDAAPDLVNQSSDDGTKPVAHITDLPALEELFRSSVRHNIQVDVNYRNTWGSTALHSRMFRMQKYEQVSMFLDDPMAEALSRVALLLEHGADVLAVDRCGVTVLMAPLDYIDPILYGEILTPSQCKDVDSMINKALKIILDHNLSFSSAAESVPALPSALAPAPGIADGDTEDKNDKEGEPAAKRQRR